MNEKEIKQMMNRFESEYPLDHTIDRAKGRSGTNRFEIYKYFEMVRIRLALEKIANK